MVNTRVSELSDVPQADWDFTTTLAVPVKELFQSIFSVELVSPDNREVADDGMICHKYLPNPALVETTELRAAHKLVVFEVGVDGTVVPDCKVKVSVSELSDVPQTDCARTITLAVPKKESFQLIVRVELVSPDWRVAAEDGRISQRYFPKEGLVETREFNAGHRVVTEAAGVFGTGVPD